MDSWAFSQNQLCQEYDLDQQTWSQEYVFMRTTLELPDELLKKAKIAAVQRGTTLRELIGEGIELVLKGTASSSPSALPTSISQANGTLALTNEIISELEEEDDIRRAFAGRYQLTHAPIRLSAGRTFPLLSNRQLNQLLGEGEPHEVSR